MTRISFVSAAAFFALLACFGDSQGIQAQPDTDALLEAMPRIQKDYFSKLLGLSKQYTEAIKLKNAVAKKEALEKTKNDTREFLADVNDKLSREGAQDWIGNASVATQTLTINYKLKQDSRLTVHIYISTKGMKKEVLDVVKKLARGDQVRFTIDGHDKTPAKMTGSQHLFSAQVPAQLLKSLSIVSPK